MPDLLTPEYRRLRELLREHLRDPIDFSNATGSLVVRFDPPLTAEEQTTYDQLVEVADSLVDLTPAEWANIRPNLQALRDLRQLGRNAFLALTAAERDRRLYDAQTDTTIILLALLRG